ncbi:helix-turn-helix domain-containing protein [Collinsella sp. AGMB00827]|uniref:Helix-turn-helix domain-containing protein n=1 Tax=Collinsella ureilytica TaxID=2869515 RepID=A0ABS7MLQ6_9ACTN|nr:helix-turn-helix domain-containing protein [Collinsella urealyticum]MBY4798286.1 helix-turn-helix domain-containing protein [Collinsella urealyticum]
MGFQEVRVRQRPRTFTIIYNDILHDRSLSLRARGLLCTVLSLPDEWDYSIAGLLKIINPEDESGNLTPHPGQGRDALYKILKELELCGYLIRERERGSAGHLGRTIYTFFDCPQPQRPAAVPSQDTDEETAGNAPHPENPDMDKPDLVNPTQLNTKEN